MIALSTNLCKNQIVNRGFKHNKQMELWDYVCFNLYTPNGKSQRITSSFKWDIWMQVLQSKVRNHTSPDFTVMVFNVRKQIVVISLRLSVNKRPKGPHIVHMSTMCKFRLISFSGFRGEVENMSANQRPGRPSCFSDWPEKHKLGRGRWDIPSCQVSLNSIQRFQRRSRKCHSLSEARLAILFFRSAWITQTW